MTKNSKCFNLFFLNKKKIDGRNIAMRYSCKFIETSAAINDKVDDLLAGILKQIRLHLTTQAHSKQNNSTRAEYKHKKKLSFISIFKSNKKNSKTCITDQAQSTIENENKSISFLELFSCRRFSKKSNRSVLNSVENLFTMPN
jgi:hypothetical protein